MKKRGFLLLTIIFMLLVLSECEEGPSADQYVGEQITAVKTEDPEIFSSLLDKGIEQMNSEYVLQFPEDLKEPYLSFLQNAFNTVEFEIAEAKKNGDDAFTVHISFTPVNIADTTKDVRNDYLAGMSSTDLNHEVNTLLDSSLKTLKDAPAYETKVNTTIDVRKTENGFSLDDSSLEILISQVLHDYMEPYASICELLDAYDFMTAYLDASFKGEVERFALHTDRTIEEATLWYEEDTFTPPDTMTAPYTDRYTAALKDIFRQCIYTVGIPQKEKGIYNYRVDVTVIPNNSLLNVFSELENGVYYSEEEVDSTIVGLLEAYAAAPVYGEETTLTISLNMSTMLNAGKDDSDFTRLFNTIIPTM